MFFAGNERLSAGELGVHQFSSSNKAQTDKTGKIQAQSQFTVSEIIGFLNEFDTPRFVFERMFENPEIYWFSPQEKQTLASDNFSLGEVPKEKMTDFLSDKLSKVVVSDTNRPDESKLPKFPNGDKARVVAFQRQFNLLGCDVGREDGKWGPSTETAFRYLSKMLSTPYSKNLLNEPKFFAKLTYQDQEVCANFTSYARYKTYWDAYLLGLEKCFDEAPHTTNIAIDHATCVWKYDEKALSKYSMGKIYHLAYQRYKAVFDLAKSSTVSYYSGAITKDQHLKNTLEKTAKLIEEHSKNIRQELGIFVPYGY